MAPRPADGTWTAEVRYAEADQQGIVFNSHYLLYCDEAMGAFCRQRGLDTFVHDVRLVTSTLTWHSPARWGDVVAVDVGCGRIGRTSVALIFDVRVGDRLCCHVETVYVHTDPDGSPLQIPGETRTALQRS